MSLSVSEIVEEGLCIGCGLCRSIAPRQIDVVLTPEGRDRPVQRAPIDPPTLDRINAVCPGVRVEGARQASYGATAQHDTTWGSAEALAIGYATDPAVRHRGSSGGLLTALGQFLLTSGRVRSILHVGASRSEPARTEPRLSFTPDKVLANAGSRYGPAPVLCDFEAVLARGEPFALIGKPCDVAAVRNLARLDPRVDRLMCYALAMVCGGASDLNKTESVLAEFGVSTGELSSLRYRGFGCPGPTRFETRDGRSFELTYRQMWAVEGNWMIQPRCKICPDAIGESADLAASDVWTGGAPTGNSEGFNGIIVRTRRGLELYEAALQAGAIGIEARSIHFGDFDDFQPHQVEKKRAAWARLAGRRAAGHAVPETHNLRLEECARLNTFASNLEEARGAKRRTRLGTLREPPATARRSADGIAHEARPAP